MENNNCRHAKGDDMDEARGTLEDDGVGELDIPRITGGHDSGLSRDR